MADFRLAIPQLLKREGGYVNNPKDYGGETKYGISKRSYPELDIANLTETDAIAIYKRDYWDKMRLDEITSQPIADELFDTGVNAGWNRAIKFLQESLNLLTGSTLAVDGLVGSKTITATNEYRYTKALVTVLNGLQFEHYRKIVERDPSQRQFLRSWLSRVEIGG